MFRIFRDSLFDPKKIITFRNHKFGYLFVYVMLLALLMSTGAFVYYLGYDSNSMITTESTGCEIRENKLICDLDNHDPNTAYNIYGYTFYFLDESESFINVPTSDYDVMVFQGTSISVYQNHALYFSWSINSVISTSVDFDQMMQSFSGGMLFVSLFINYLSNILMMFIFILISSLTFLSFKKYMKYREIFILVGFAATPIAAVMIFYGLIPMSDFVFILLLLGSYYSLYILKRSLSIEIITALQTRAAYEAQMLAKTEEESTSDKEDENL